MIIEEHRGAMYLMVDVFSLGELLNGNHYITQI